MEALAGIELDAQYRILREAAGWVERDRALLVVRGSEAAEYLHSQLTNDIEALEPGRGCYAALLDRKGHMQGDLDVLHTAADEFVTVLEPIAQEAVLKHLEMYRVGREVELDDISPLHTTISVIGPAASALLGIAPLGGEKSNRHEELGGHTCLAVETELGIDLQLGSAAREGILAALEAAGIEAVGEQAAEVLRVELGRPRFGAEMTTRTIPQEAGINERAISFTKGCYIGQETVARLHYKGKPNRHLRGLRLASPAAPGDPVRLEERELGEIGTAVLSPAHGPIALAILRREGEPGAKVIVGDGVEATVVEPPF